MSSNELSNLDVRRPGFRWMNRYTRTLLTLFDQGVFSIATYLTSVCVARAGQSQLGWYFLVFTLWVFGTELHNSLVSTPQMLRLPRLKGERARAFNGSVLIHQAVLSLAATAFLLIVAVALYLGGRGNEQVEGFALVSLMGAISVAPLALRSFARNHCFTLRDPVTATVIDVVVSVLQLGGVWLVFWAGLLERHWWLAIVIVAVANLVASILWLAMSRTAFKPRLARSWIDFRRDWPTSRYIYLSSTLWTAGTYLYPWLISFIGGEHQAGIWAACFTLANLGNPLIMGIQNVMGPSIAHAFAGRSLSAFRTYVLKCSVLFTLIGSVGTLLMAVFAEYLLLKINGPEYAGFGPVTGWLAATMLLQGLSFPTSRGLFSLEKAKLDMFANIGPLVVLAALGALLTHHYGVMGAAICLVISQVVGSALRIVFFLQVSASPHERGLELADKQSAAV